MLLPAPGSTTCTDKSGFKPEKWTADFHSKWDDTNPYSQRNCRLHELLKIGCSKSCQKYNNHINVTYKIPARLIKTRRKEHSNRRQLFRRVRVQKSLVLSKFSHCIPLLHFTVITLFTSETEKKEILQLRWTHFKQMTLYFIRYIITNVLMYSRFLTSFLIMGFRFIMLTNTRIHYDKVIAISVLMTKYVGVGSNNYKKSKEILISQYIISWGEW